MCLEYEWEYHRKIAEEIRERMKQRDAELAKPKPAAPAAAPQGRPKDVEPVPA
jgi:hypothetical protein